MVALLIHSPECVPNQSSLDFSVYNLDPYPRTSSSTTASRAFPNPSSSVPSPASSSWAGKGFLSWALSEQGAGATLARGRLLREYEFAAANFAEGGGLEALMAASNGNGEEEDGKGWGLEVTLTLRQVNPDGNAEFAGRKAFENMLDTGKSSSTSSLIVSSSPPRPPEKPVFAKPALPPKSPSPLRRGTLPPRNTLSPRTAPPPQPRLSPRKPEPPRVRENTPPPPPKQDIRPRTPPPQSPSRAALMNLLKNEGKVSPDMARKIANSDFLVRLLKASGGSPSKNRPALATTQPPNKQATRLPEAKLGDEKPHPPSDHVSPWAATPSNPSDACYNCGTTESSQWMSKKLKDGSTGRVCNSCGLYFNKHKRMRPRELWAGVPHSDPAPMPVRSSPRLNRTRPAPPPESPRKRPRTKPTPAPSPRMATRASARAAADDATTPTPGGLGGMSLDFSSHFPFDADIGAPNGPASAPAAPDDLESMFLQLDNGDPGGVTIESLFGDGDTENILELLRTIESEGMAAVSNSEP